MKLILKLIAVLLLMVNGIGALYGGWSLITDPTGTKLQLAQSYLEHTPFNNYFIPGLVLFLLNGVLSMVILLSILFNYKHSAKLIIAQGIILTGWIVVQMMMIQVIYYLHWVLGGLGIALVIVGYLLSRLQSRHH